MNEEEIVIQLRENPGLNDHQRAVLEYMLYEEVKSKDVEKLGKPEFLRRRYGFQFYPMKYRSLLHEEGEKAALLWQAIREESMTLEAAAKIMRVAKRWARSTSEPLEKTIEWCLGERMKASRPRTGRPWERNATAGTPQGPRFPNPLEYIQKICGSATEWLSKEYSTLTPAEIAEIGGQLQTNLIQQCANINTMVALVMQRKARQAANARYQYQAPPWSHSRVKDRVNEPRPGGGQRYTYPSPPESTLDGAFRALDLSPPAGEAINLAKVRKAYVDKVKKTHPDQTKDETKRPEYEAAVRAYKTICDHYAETEKKK